MSNQANRRVLVIDDNPAIHDDFRKILVSSQPIMARSLEEKEAALFGDHQSQSSGLTFEVDSAYQGQEGVEAVIRAKRSGRPFALAFVDIRMPPGLDGIETIERILPIDPDIQLVICSAYSDYSTQEILSRVGLTDRLLLLRKPCDAAEILLISAAMTEKWNLAQSHAWTAG